MTCLSNRKDAMTVRDRLVVSKLGRRDGFTLIELVVIIIVLGIVAAVAIPKLGTVVSDSKTTTTRAEMLRLKSAIVGDPSVTAGGRYVNKGYYNDVGALPTTLADLAVKPGAVATYNKFTGLGWNGPYIDSTGGDYLKDSWGVSYTYSAGSRTITSTGSGSSIVVSF